MDGNELMALFVVCLTLGTVSVALLRPISKQLAKLFEAMALERTRPPVAPDFERLRDLLETLHGRLDRIEERQDFTDALLGSAKDHRTVRAGAGGSEARVPPSRED
jgi:hypothetical protein